MAVRAEKDIMVLNPLHFRLILVSIKKATTQIAFCT
jgi:hypothetical protein